MPATSHFMMIEPAFSGTHWCEQCVQGIRQEVSRNKGTLEEILPEDEKALRRVSAQERPLLILVGSLVNWMTDMVQRLNEMGIHSIMMTSPPPDGDIGASTISMDYNQAICDLMCYLTQMGRERVAMFGIHPNSINDLTKLRFFQNYMAREKRENALVFWNRGSIDELCRELYAQLPQMDAVLCSNDIIAIKLHDYLKKKGVDMPERLRLTSLGETRLSQLVRPSIAMASLNYADIGQNAVRLYNILRRNDTITALHAKVVGRITMRGPVDFAPCHCAHFQHAPLPPEQSNFYADEDVARIFVLENLISHCLPIDFAILRGLIAGIPYRMIAEESYTSENSIKYRIKRMLELAQCGTKEQLLQRVLDLLQPEDLPLE